MTTYWRDDPTTGEIEPDPEGDWVRREAYEDLEEQFDALRGYARHANDCSWWEPPYFGRGIEGSACSCGLHEVLGVSNPASRAGS